ncbi:unnamed protein product [Owenia fusiformis]|uniref:Uncharacterized protein n=1 Tax=Owenia fusiformis TaxID=6347 RepID=A0A8S4QCL8_OWEFU|nr:unnamed protein product [Owenia fusiformis]
MACVIFINNDPYWSKHHMLFYVSTTVLLIPVAKDALFCLSCVLFRADNNSSFTKEIGYTNWSNRGASVKKHNATDLHKGNTIGLDNFYRIGINNNNDGDVVELLVNEDDRIIRTNKEIMLAILDAVIFLGSQNMAFRGKEDLSNCMSLVKYTASKSQVLQDH